MYNAKFIEKVVNWGMVDTKKYRYVYRCNFVGCWIERIKREYLGTDMAYRYDAWDLIWKEGF